MKAKLIDSYGGIKKNTTVSVLEEGYDWILLKNGIYVPKCCVIIL